jgi:hypothetical protein
MPPKKEKKPAGFTPKNFYSSLDKKYKRLYHNPNKNKHHLEIPFRALLIGPSGSGKTSSLLNLIQVFNGTFNRIVVCCKSRHEPLYDMLSDKIPGNLLRFYEGYENIPSINDLKKDLNLEGVEQILMVFDDLNNEKKQDKIIEYFKMGRKAYGSISSIYLAQSYYAIPKFIRTNSQLIIFKKLSSLRDLKLILHEYQLDISIDDLMRLYKYSNDNFENWFMIDMENPNADLKYRKNFTPITV